MLILLSDTAAEAHPCRLSFGREVTIRAALVPVSTMAGMFET